MNNKMVLLIAGLVTVLTIGVIVGGAMWWSSRTSQRWSAEAELVSQ
jgi:hypothetical protein